jgi:hypothetical protein
MTTLGRKLRRSGHHVTVVARAVGRAKVPQAGLGFVVIGEREFSFQKGLWAKPPHIAIVEDDASFRRAIERLPRVSGFEAQTFASAEESGDPKQLVHSVNSAGPTQTSRKKARRGLSRRAVYPISSINSGSAARGRVGLRERKDQVAKAMSGKEQSKVWFITGISRGFGWELALAAL